MAYGAEVSVITAMGQYTVRRDCFHMYAGTMYFSMFSIAHLTRLSHDAGSQAQMGVSLPLDCYRMGASCC